MWIIGGGGLSKKKFLLKMFSCNVTDVGNILANHILYFVIIVAFNNLWSGSFLGFGLLSLGVCSPSSFFLGLFASSIRTNIPIWKGFILIKINRHQTDVLCCDRSCLFSSLHHCFFSSSSLPPVSHHHSITAV